MAERVDVNPPESGPAIDDLAPVFAVYEVRQEDDELLYLGEPRASRETIMRRVWPMFRERGYEVRLDRRTGEYALVAEPVELGIDGVPWTNVILAVATIVSTLWAGSVWYYLPQGSLLDDPIATVATVWPFAAAVLGVLGVHEFGHYVMSRRHNVQASLPYFIPIPTIIGTMGAVIRMKGQMPSRKALFDIGVAGPLAGLAATVVVTAIGLAMDPIRVPSWVLDSPNTYQIRFGYPPLFRLIAVGVGEAGIATGLYTDPAAVLLGREGIGYASRRLATNPVVFGGWVGMFVTFLNLLPVGQLDGGHIARAILGERHATVAAIVPGALFGLAGYLFYVRNAGSAVGIWVFWGLLALMLAYAGSATPVFNDDLGAGRKLVGVVAFVLGLLCFVPVPISIVP